MTAEVIYLYAYDIAHEADLSALEASLRGSAEWFDLGRLKDAPRAFPVYRPLAIQMNSFSGEGSAGPVTLHPSVKVFSVGALSVKIRLPVHCNSPADLLQYRDLRFKDGTTVEARAHDLARQVFTKIREHLDTPVADLPQPEGYTVFCVGELGESVPDAEAWLVRNERTVAALLVGEPNADRLSTREVEDTLKYRYSYYQHDLAVIDWDAALIVDAPEDYNDTLYVMELANLQLEELRTYDGMLDGALDKAYDDVEKAAHHYIGRGRQRVLDELRGIRMDVTKVADEISNITKFFGDWHLARLYMGCASRFHLSEWEASVNQKLGALNGLYTMLQQDNNNRIMLILEASIVALFVIDLGLIVWLAK